MLDSGFRWEAINHLVERGNPGVAKALINEIRTETDAHAMQTARDRLIKLIHMAPNGLHEEDLSSLATIEASKIGLWSSEDGDGHVEHGERSVSFEALIALAKADAARGHCLKTIRQPVPPRRHFAPHKPTGVPREQEYIQALANAEAKFGPNHQETALRVLDLARLCRLQERYDEAEAFLLRAGGIWEVVAGQESLQRVRTLEDLAVVYSSQKRYAEAEDIYRWALAVREKEAQRIGSPKNRTEVTATAKALAKLLRIVGRAAEAETLERGK